MSLRHLYKDLNGLGVYPDLFQGTRTERIDNKYYGWRFQGDDIDLKRLVNIPYVHVPSSNTFFKNYKEQRCRVMIINMHIFITFYDENNKDIVQYVFIYGNPSFISGITKYMNDGKSEVRGYKDGHLISRKFMIMGYLYNPNGPALVVYT